MFDSTKFLEHIIDKNSAVAEMGDRSHNIHGPKKGALLCPFRKELGPTPSNTWAEVYFRTK